MARILQEHLKLNDEHVNHQIITEDEFMNNIENLIDLFQEVDNNQIKYLILTVLIQSQLLIR